MTEKELQKLHLIRKEIELLHKQINSLAPEVITDKVTGSLSEFPYIMHSITISGIDEDEYNRKSKRLERKLKLRLDELMDAVEEIDEYISKQEDSEIRQILSLKYINRLPWRQVAEHLGYADESVPRKKINRFLKMTDKSES
ncbi:RNA polymerase subunit sigma-24 [Alkaliphilus sp. B6464]|uniref:RNA polymerase subunit sigma-24 n=1 Tax=Alkaliphilus sp. B6464 TaxID=2731219 RepID=UPI001BA7148F|nr:RNA polymerase subunit sigma-24 [Alkaliphilus sp. B6464]QUH21093.1 RNA polymerase subunit sigma-24 [Alkaliphilus sp. B6464]